MTYIVQVWERAKGEWRTVHERENEWQARVDARTLSDAKRTNARVMGKPSELDVLKELQLMQRQGLVDVALVHYNWRWTLREDVE